MKSQQELVKMFFSQGDRARWVQPTFDRGVVGTRLAVGTVHSECANRPGFYYVRDDHDNRLHLIIWNDLDPVP